MPSRSHSLSLVSLSMASLLSVFGTAKAQYNTQRQDVTTMANFFNQKECAQTCFVRTGFCPLDNLGRILGCAQYDCGSKYFAINDCYCRADLQQAAHSHLTSCIRNYCTVGDAAIDAVTAGSIYDQYCGGLGYVPPAPAPAQAVPTATATAQGPGVQAPPGATRAQPAGPGVATLPTSTSTSAAGKGSSKDFDNWSTPKKLGVILGAIAGFAILCSIISLFRKPEPVVEVVRRPGWVLQRVWV